LRLATEARLQQLLLPRFYWPLNELARRKSPTYRNASLAEEIASEIGATALGVSAAQERAGLRWLRRAPALDALRQAGTSRYAAALGESGASFAVPPQVRTGALYYFPVLTEHKAQLLAEAERRNLELVAWPVATPIFPIEREEFLPKYRYRPGSCPVAERVARELVGLPTDGRAPPNDLIELVLRHGTTK
jgi:dTDP-4-amino-4,6-dideoxygalactose transaminase